MLQSTNQITLMSRLQQWMSPESGRNEMNSSFRLRSSKEIPCSAVHDFASPAQTLTVPASKPFAFNLSCDFSVPPPPIRIKSVMRQPSFSKKPPPDVLPVLTPDFSVPPPNITGSFKSLSQSSSMSGFPKSCLLSPSSMVSLNKEQGVWQKVLCTVQSAVNHGQAKRELLEVLQGIKLSDEEHVVMESNNNNNAALNSTYDGYRLRPAMTGISRAFLNMTGSLPEVKICKQYGASAPIAVDSGCQSKRKSADSLRSDIYSSSTPSSDSSGINAEYVGYSKDKSLVPSGCTFCYAHFKRHCQLQ
uniref:Uncharacterized protein n=1 Tax=Ditylenchus dipsaci TaxID=166011 RepID=A0A915DRQ1_9BILA